MVKSNFPRCLGKLLLLSLTGGILFWTGTQAATAQASNCLQNEFTAAGNSQTLGCTANDVRVAKVTNTRNPDGTPITTCILGSRVSFVATYQVVTSSSSSRSNIGLYFGTDGQDSALTGSCSDNIIPPNPGVSVDAFCTGAGTPYSFCTSAGHGTSPVVLKSDNYLEQDPSPDNCGDGAAQSTQNVDVLVSNVLCEPISATDNHLKLANCTSWQVPGKTIACTASAPLYQYPFNSSGAEAIPGSPSKCNCEVLEVPITVQHAKLGVTKSATVESPTGTDGSPADYTVVITNASDNGSVTVNQLCDDKYGNIKTAAGGACAGGTECPILECTSMGAPFSWCTGAGTGMAPAGSTCATNVTCNLPATLAAPGDSVTCTFTGQIPENSTVNDTVTANALDQSGSPLNGQANASATAGDAPSAAVLTKTATGAVQGCATVRYGASVKNNSGTTTDESLTLSALNDNAFGDITTTHGSSSVDGSVVGTTCNQVNGIGTLLGTAGAGTFASVNPLTPGQSYSCQFDGVICSFTASNPTGTLSTISLPGGGTCTGIQHSNQLSTTLAGDETGDAAPSVTGGGLTVYECFSTTSQ